MKRLKLSLAIFGVSAFIPHFLHAEAGRTALGILNRSYGARAAGMGEAQVADVGEIDSMSFNPSGMAWLDHSAVAATYNNGLTDDQFGYLNYGKPTRFGSFWVTGSYLDAGTIDLNLSDGTKSTRRAQQDMVVALGAAVGRTLPVSLGISGKLFKSELAETAQVSGAAMDVGASWRLPIRGLSLGAAYQNIGPNVSYEQNEDQLPTVGRAGISYALDLQDNWKLYDLLRCRYLLLVDGVKQRNEDGSMNVGLEIRRRINMEDAQSSAALRAGYKGENKSGTIGIGFVFHRISFDYAIGFLDPLDNAHRFTLGYQFSS